MNPKIPSKELETKKKERWRNEEQDPWRGITEMLANIDPVNMVPESYDFSALHDKVMDAVNEIEPAWAKKKRS